MILVTQLDLYKASIYKQKTEISLLREMLKMLNKNEVTKLNWIKIGLKKI